MANILRIKDSDGNWTDIPALVGPQGTQGVQGEVGTSAYAAACSGGYTGTEKDFNLELANVGNKTDKCVPAKIGSFAALTASGELADSGYGESNFITGTALHTAMNRITSVEADDENYDHIMVRGIGLEPVKYFDNISPAYNGSLVWFYE